MDCFTLKSLFIKHRGKKIFDVTFVDNTHIDRDFPLTTVIIGENGSGKSYLLTIVSELFRGLDLIQREKEIKFKYDEYKINYEFNGNNVTVQILNNRIKCMVNGRELSVFELDLPKSILAVSFMINDKFTFSTSHSEKNEIYSYLGVRRTSNATYTTTLVKKITDSLILNLHHESFSEKVLEILDFLNFEPKLRLKFTPVNKTLLTKEISLKQLYNKMNTFKDKSYYRSDAINKYSDDSINDLYEYLNSIIVNNKSNDKDSKDIIININLKDTSQWNKNIKQFKYLNMLIELQLIKSPALLLMKFDEFDFEDASSGEKHLLFTLINLAAEIKRKSIILIDEPELSLHPNWQMKYISIIKKLFKEYSSCHFIIATHSHYIISDLENNSSSIIHISIEKNKEKLFRHAKLLNVDTYAWSAENILYNIFGVRTSRNYYFENDLKNLISLLEDRSDDTEKISNLIKKFETIIIDNNDPLQMLFIEAKEYLKSVNSNKQSNKIFES